MRHTHAMLSVGLRLVVVSIFVVSTILSAVPIDQVIAADAQKPLTATPPSMIITGVVDGPLTGGIPKAIEVYVVGDIADLSIYGLGSANNGGGTDGEEFTFPADSVSAGDFLYIATEITAFTAFFGFAPDYTSSAASINGDDAIELFQNGSVIDVFGDITVSGTGTSWDYLDGWAYRVDASGPDGNTFVLANWSFSGTNALDGETTNAAATTPFPLGTYSDSASVTDNPPTVSSTTPADTATDIAVDADITVNFSEDVTVSGTWFTLSCASSGAHTAAVTGGSQSYTLNPDTDFSNNELCTITIVAAQVADQDGTTDNMAADDGFSFTTIAATPPTPKVVINEFLADPASDLTGDANGDGTRDSSDDEFVEIVNISGAALDVSGWTLSDAVSVRHIFPANTVIPANCNIVVFGGDTPTGTFGNALVQTASTGFLGLNNTGDTITISDSSVDQATTTYGSAGGDNQSLTLDPDITGASFVKHSVATGSAGALFSPGTKIDGTNFSGCIATHMIINEVDADQTGTDTAEFVELYDGGAGNTPLDGLVLVFFNGSDDQSCLPVFDLDGYSTDANGYFVIGNTAVSGVDLIFSDNSLQNGADAVALYVGDDTDFPNDTAITTTNLLDAIVYDTNDGDDTGLLALLNTGQPQVDEAGGGDSTTDSNQRCDNDTGGQRNTDTYTQSTPTPGSANNCQTAPVLGCGDAATLISAIQGTGPDAAITGEVTVEAIVTADYQESGELSGFFIQEEDAQADANPLSSEGIFVYNTSNAVAVGDKVRLTGTAGEYFDMTQISSVSALEVCSSSNTLPTVTPMLVPFNDSMVLEAVEGMLVRFTPTLYVTETYTLGRYGEVWLSSVAPLNNPTNVAEPGAAADLVAAANALNRILLDDASTYQNPSTVPYLRSTNDTLRIGDTTTNLTGVINYSFDYYRLQPTGTVNFAASNASPTVPAVGGTLKVASFNVLNYFTTLGSRGADTALEFTRQRDKIISAITTLNADVIGLMEIENNGYGTDGAIYDLVSGLNDVAGAGTYAFVDPGTVIGTDEIAVGLIYKPGSVETVGSASILDSSVDPRFIDTSSRPALAQTFRDLSNDGQFTVVVNHLKSKGSDCDSLGDPDTGDGQGNCNLTRTSAAQALVDWLETDPTGTLETDFLIIGDLNSYAKEDPIDAIKLGADDTAGTDDDYTDLVAQFAGSGHPYSYVFNGERGYLDHALGSSSMLSQVTGTTHWHINSDEPLILDYNTEYGQEALNLYVANPYRSSDHDPVVIGLNLAAQSITDLPLLTTKSFSLLQGTEYAFEPLDDSNPNGQAWDQNSIRIVIPPKHGTAWVASIHYVPFDGFVGADSLTYEICDATNQCWRVEVLYNITAESLPDTGFTPDVITQVSGVSTLQPLANGGISLVIPKLGVDANIVGVPLAEDGWDVSWLSGQVGYLDGTAYPTWDGNTVLTAHSVDANGLPGLFNKLQSLRWGEIIQIEAYGLTYTYQVREIEQWASPTAGSAFQHETLDWITLVTCQGFDAETNTYPYRTIVRAVLVDVQ